MSYTNKRSNKKLPLNTINILLISFVVIFVGAIFGIFAYSRRSSDSKIVPLQNNSSESDTMPSGKQPEPAQSNASQDNKEKSSSDEVTSRPIDTSISIEKSYQQDTGDLVLQTIIIGQGTGTCQLKLTLGTSTISKSADVLFQSTYSTCTGFVIPSSEINGGRWKAELNLIDVTGKITATTNKEIVINK